MQIFPVKLKRKLNLETVYCFIFFVFIFFLTFTFKKMFLCPFSFHHQKGFQLFCPKFCQITSSCPLRDFPEIVFLSHEKKKVSQKQSWDFLQKFYFFFFFEWNFSIFIFNLLWLFLFFFTLKFRYQLFLQTFFWLMKMMFLNLFLMRWVLSLCTNKFDAIEDILSRSIKMQR